MQHPDSFAPLDEEEIFQRAAALPLGAREAFIRDACAENPAAQQRIQRLVRLHEDPLFMEAPIPLPISLEIEEELARLKPEEPGERIGPYKLLQQIGEGGFGTVWMAEQEKPVRRRVALKIIKMGMDTKEVIARFEQERQALAMMEHPNIASVIDAGSTPFGRPFFVMELVRGVKITEYCDQTNLTTTDRLKLFVAVCNAVQHAHQKGIIHRDLKPSNILVTLHDGVPVPKVIDFGVAKATLSQRLTDLTLFTQFEQMIGTPLYMAPEQAELSGLDIDTRSDIYSLGVLLYELLTGRTPFDPDRLMKAGYDEMRRVIREEEPKKPSTYVSTLAADKRMDVAKHRGAEGAKLVGLIRGDLDWIVMKALEKNRNRRYETASALARDLERHLASEPVLARPPSAGYRFRRFVKRHKVAVTAGGSIAAALIAGLALSTWAFLGEREQRRIADEAKVLANWRRDTAETERREADEQRRIARESAAQAVRSENYSQRLLYASDMNLAQQALEQNNLWRARRLLDRHRPQTGKPDLRGWEWRLLWNQCLGDTFSVLTRHSARAFSVSFSYDGSRLAVGYFDGRVELWDVPTRTLNRVLQEADPQPEEQGQKGHVAFSPVSDALASSGRGGEVRWYDFAAGQEVVLCKAPGFIRDLSFSADGARLVALSRLKEAALIIDTTSRKTLRQIELPSGGDRHLNNARISPDHERLYITVGGITAPAKLVCLKIADESVLWQANVADPIERAAVGFSAMDLSPDGKCLVTATAFDSNKIQIWDAEHGIRQGVLSGHSGWTGEVTFSPDGRTLASASKDQTVRFWDTRTWREVAGPLRGSGDELYAAAYAPDGDSIVTAARDGSVTLWNLAGRQPANGRSVVRASAVRALPRGDSVLVSDKGKFSVLELATLKEVKLAFSESKRSWFVLPKFLGIQEDAGVFQLHEVTKTGAKLVAELLIAPSGQHIAYSEQKRLLAWSDDARTIHLTPLDKSSEQWDLETGENAAQPVSFTEDGQFLLAAGPKGVARVWDLATKKRLPAAEAYLSPFGLEIFAKKANRNQSDAISRWAEMALRERPQFPPRESLASAAQPNLAGIYPEGAFSDFSLSPDGRTFAISTQHGDITVYDAVRLEKIARFSGRATTVWSLAFSPDGTRLAVMDDVLWDMATRQELMALPMAGAGHGEPEFTPDGSALMIAHGGACQVWRAPSWEEIERVEREGGGWSTSRR